MTFHCSQSSVHALYRVFVLPTLSKCTSTYTTLLRPLQNTRQFSYTPLRSAKPRGPEVRTQRWDEEITARQVYLVDEKTGKLSERTHSPREVLSTLDTRTHRLIQLTQNETNQQQQSPLKSGSTEIPVCKIISKADLYQSARRKRDAQREARKSGSRSGADSMKTLELNWAIDANDLGHRLLRLKEFLSEGRKVEVVLAAKKHGRKASAEECGKLVERIRGAVEEVSGAREKPGGFDGKVGGVVKWTLVGSVVATTTTTGGGGNTSVGSGGAGKEEVGD